MLALRLPVRRTSSQGNVPALRADHRDRCRDSQSSLPIPVLGYRFNRNDALGTFRREVSQKGFQTRQYGLRHAVPTAEGHPVDTEARRDEEIT